MRTHLTGLMIGVVVMSATSPLFAAGQGGSDLGAEYDKQLREQIKVYEQSVEENLGKLERCNPSEAKHYRGMVAYARRMPLNGRPIPDNITGKDRTRLEIYDQIW